MRIVEQDELWGQPFLDVLSPAVRRVLRLRPGDLLPLEQRTWSPAEVQWRAAALRALALAVEGEPLAVRHGGVTLLPHQVSTLERALALDHVRLAVCDEVGLGKTITAGAIAAELRARRRARRILVVAPKGVQLQWVAEMRERFGEEYVRVGPEGVPIEGGPQVWRAFDRVVTSLDAIKPLRARAGWSVEQVRRYNEARFAAVVAAGWDMVILDEAHHVSGSEETVARHILAQELAAASPNLLLLSATPHSGKSEAFRRFLGLLDPAFFAGAPITPASVEQVIARTEKRSAVDGQGRPLFQPRATQLEPVPWGPNSRHRPLYEEVTDYVRDGYSSAKASGRTATGFLMLLLQRLLASSTPAILSALERRLAAVSESLPTSGAQQFDLEEWDQLTGEEQVELLRGDSRSVLAGELQRLRALVDLARGCHSAGPDPKTLHFLAMLRRLRREERDPQVKVLVFTEFRATQQMLAELLDGQGIPTVTVNGEMGLGERAIAQQRFRTDAAVLVSTDAGGEGVNLQFAHLVVNWDLPWAPTRIEQRIGRLDRIGQQNPVRAFNLVLEDSVDLRVLQVLQDKLDTIAEELGADKRADILDSADRLVDDVFTRAILDPTAVEAAADEFSRKLRDDLAAHQGQRALLHQTTSIQLRPREPQLPVVLARAAAAWTRLGRGSLTDPAEALERLPTAAPGEPVPEIRIGADGWLALWRVTADDTESAAYAVWRSASSPRVDPHHAQRIWQALCDGEELAGTTTPTPEVWSQLVEQGRDYGYNTLQKLAHGRPVTPRLDLALLVRTLP